MHFKPNGSSISYEVSSVQDIKRLLEEKVKGFSNIEIDKERKLVLGKIDDDPTFIGIGKIEL